MKLRLPHKFQAALIAALASVSFTTLSTGSTAQAATTYKGVTYSGYIYNIATSQSATFHDRDFTNYYSNDGGTTWLNSTTFNGNNNNKIYYNGTEQKTATGGVNFWRFAFGDGNGKYSTLRLDGGSGTVYLEAQFTPLTLGGLIAEKGDATYIVGRKGGGCAIVVQAESGTDANMYIGANTILSSGVNDGSNTITVASGGTWVVDANKTLTLGRHTGSAFADTTKITFDNGVRVNMTGGGTVDLTHTRALETGIGATISVGENTLLKFASNTKLGGTITNAGTVTFDGTVTLNDDLSGFKYEAAFEDYEESEGKGFAGAKDYTIISNTATGTGALTSVIYNGETKQLDNGVLHMPGEVDYSTYYIKADNTALELAQAVAYAQGHGGNLTTVNVQGDNATITVGSNQSLATLSIAGGKSATVNGEGTLTLASLSLGTGSTLSTAGTVTMNVASYDTSQTLNLGEGTTFNYTRETDQTLTSGQSLSTTGAGMFTYGHILQLQDGSMSLGSNSNISEVYTRGTGTINLTGGTHEWTKLGMGQNQTSNYTLNVQSGATLHITGTAVADSNDHRFSGSFQLSHWGGTNTLNVYGKLISNAVMSSWDGTANINVKSGGELELRQGLTRNYSASGTTRDDASHKFTLTVENGGTLTVGATPNGDNFSHEGLVVTMQSGATLGGYFGAANDVTVYQNITGPESGTLTFHVDGTGNTLTMQGTLSGDAALVKTGSGTFMLANGYTLNHVIDLRGGSIGFAGDMEIGGIHHEGTTHYTGGAVEGTNGFASLVTSLQLVNMGTDTAIGDTSGAHFTIDGVTATLDATGLAKTSGEVDYATFHVLDGSENVSQGRKNSHNPTYSLANGTTLVVDDALQGSQLTREGGSTGNATLNIQSGKTYTSDGNEKHVTITGAGTYALTKTTANGNWFDAPMVDTLAPEWTGTVKLANMTKLGNLNLNNYGNEHSSVMLDGVTAYLNATTFNTKLLLGSGGFTVVDGGSGSTYTFAGGVGGVGNFTINYTANPSGMSFVFSGDVKDWTGSLVYNVNKENKVVFKGGATEVNATITRSQGTMNMEVGDGTNAFTTTFNETVGASKLTIQNGASATFEKAVTLSGDLSLLGSETARASVLLKGGGSVNVIDLSNSSASHGTVTVAAEQTLTYSSSFWGANNNKLILEEGATVKKATDAPIEIVGLEDSGYVSSSTNEQLLLDKSAFTLHNVKATVNTDSDNVQLHFDNSKFVTSHTVTLKNTESVFSGMDIQGGTTTVGATGLTSDTTVTLGRVALSGESNLALADHVVGSVSGIDVTGTSTISGGTLKMGSEALITLGENAGLTLSGVTVDLTSKELQGGGTRYDFGQNAGNGFAITEGKVQLVDFATGSTISEGTGVSYKYGSNNGTLVTDEGENQGYVTFGDASYSAFYVNTPNTVESLSVAVEKSIGQPTGPLTEVYLKAGTLNTDGADPLNALHIDSGDGTVYLTGAEAGFATLDGSGTLNVAAATNLNGYTLSVAAGETLTLEGGATISYSHIANHGTLGIGTDTTVATTGDITVSAGDTFTTTGEGTLASTAELKVLGGTATLGSESEWSAIRMGNGSLNINADTTVSGMVELGPENGQMNGNLTVNNGATLTASQVKASWGYSTMAINGIVNATEKFSIATGSSNEVTGTGTINTANLDVSNVTVKATFKGGLTINVGDGGITGGQPLELQDVTIGVLEGSNGWTASRAITLGSADTGTTFNIGNGKEVTLSGAISGSGKLVKDGDGTLNLASNINNTDYTGNMEVKDGTLTVNGTNGAAFHSVSVAEGATVELIGKSNQDYRFRYTLDGGTLTSSGSATGGGNVQNDQITLTKNSTISGSANFYMLGGSYNETSLNLGGHTLTKEGTNTVNLINTDVSTGSIVVKDGTLNFVHRSDKPDSRVEADIELNGGTITGAYTYKASDSPVTRNLTVNQSAATNAAIMIGNNVTLATSVAENQVLTLGGAITGTGNFSLSGPGTLKLAGSDMISANTLTFASGSTLDVSNVAQMAGITVNLASYTGSASYSGMNITGVNSGLTYSLTDDGSHVAITFASAPSPTPFKPVVDLGNVMYVGDSITDGVTSGSDHAKSWRYSFFQVLADGGIDQNEQGYYQHSQSSGAITETTYGGRDFENNHSARASARSWETAGVPTSEKGGDRYDSTSILNWLGQSQTKRNGQPYPDDKPVYKDENAPNTYFMLLGTNDLLSEGGNHVTDEHFANVLASMFGYNGSTFDGTSGTFDKIWNAMTTARTDSQLIVLEMPTWSPDHTNHQYAADFAYMTKFNQKLHEWVDSKANKAQITIVNPNPGIVDVANTTKPGAGVASMFLSDHLHPSAQGELLIAGNVAKQLGYAGRTVGLARANSSTTGTTWDAAANTSITVTDGAAALTFAEDAFSTTNGYTIDFGALYGDGFSGGWSDKANALTVQVGDGYNIGTLTFSEAYVMWGGTVLYSRDNSQEGDNFRIAYVNQSVNEADHVSTGYYVWMGDQLIGEALSGVSGSFNGISLTSTGANGTVKNLTWSNTAYAPTTELYENPDATKLFHLEQANTLPTHTDTPQGIREDIEWQTTTDKFALPSGQSSTEKTIYKEYSSNIGANYTGAANADYEGDIGMHYTGTVDMDARQSVLSVYNATVTGNVYVQFDNPNTVYNSFTNTNRLSVTAGYNGNITGSYTAVYNAGIFNYDVRGGEHTNANATIGGGSYSYVNGGTFKANVMGGGVTGTINGGTHVTVSGGEIAGSVYGGGIGGTINDGTYVTITGGVIAGNVIGGGTGGTINGGTHVTVKGILPSIKGNISADNVTLKDVVNPQEYVDGFDSYKGTITATTLTLDNYKAGEMLATVTAANLALTNGTDTVINNLTTAAGTAISVDATSSLTLGQANLSAAISNAGTLVLTQDITASGLVEESHTDYRVGADDEKSENGNYFYTGTRTESTIRVVSGAGDLQVADGLTVTQGGVDYAMAANGTATGVTAEADYSTFYQGQAGTTVSVAQVAATAALHDTELLAVYSLGTYPAPTVLNVDRDVQNVMLGFATMNIGADVTFTGDLLIFGGMNTVSGRVGTEQLGFFAAQDSVTTFTDAPIQDGGVTFTSDQGAGGVMVQANKVADDDQHYYRYAINDDHYAVVASELAKDGNGDATVANSLQVNRVHNSKDGVTGDLTLSAGVVAAALHEVEATSGNVEFLNMVAANGSASPDVSLNKLEIGAGKVVGFYEAAAPTSMEEMVAETSVTVVGTLTAGEGARLNANLVMTSGSTLDVSGTGGNGLAMGSSVTLNRGVTLSDGDMAAITDLGFMDQYTLFTGVDAFSYDGTTPTSTPIAFDSETWVKASEIFINTELGAKDYYVFYSGVNAGGNGGNVGTIYIVQVPEPTTGTLSLLALAALAARRRRK